MAKVITNSAGHTVGTLSTDPATDGIGTGSGWISPTGNWWMVDNAGHWRFASERTASADPVTALERKGWLHVSWGNIFVSDRGHEVTNEQYDTLVALAPHFRNSSHARNWAYAVTALDLAMLA